MNESFMKRAYVLAKKGEGFTSPNPCVGAVIVKNGKVLAEGWHKKAGEDHAEIVAIKKMKDVSRLKDAELYVTLEPCCHTGKTPPCVNKIIEVGIKKVKIGMKDPFSEVNGRGVKLLKKSGIDVEVLSEKSDLYGKIRELNQPFIKSVKVGFPYVTIKAGISLDGKIATSNGDSKWITSDESRNDARLERNKHDCVIVGAGTVEKDDPMLGDKLRIIIDKFLSSNPKKKVFRDKNVFVATTDMSFKNRKELFMKNGINFKSFGKHTVSIEKLLKYLNSIGVRSVFVEGGSHVHGHFYDSFLKNPASIDKVIFYVAPKLMGGETSLPVIGGKGVDFVNKIREFSYSDIVKIGKDLKITGVFNSY